MIVRVRNEVGLRRTAQKGDTKKWALVREKVRRRDRRRTHKSPPPFPLLLWKKAGRRRGVWNEMAYKKCYC